MPRAATRRRALAAALACAAMLSACTGSSDDASGRERPLPSPRTPPRPRPPRPWVRRRRPPSTPPRPVPLPGTRPSSGRRSSRPTPTPRRCRVARPPRRPTQSSRRTGVKVLAISRGGDTPPQVLAQTTLKKTGAAVLVLLVGGQGRCTVQGGRRHADAPGGQARRARPHDRRLGRRRRRRRPERQARRRRRCLRRVREVPQADRDHSCSPTTRCRSSCASRPRAQSQALNNQGAFTQEHDPKGIVGGLRLKDGKGAIVFAHLVRSDAIAMRSPVKLTPGQGPHAPDRHQADHDRGQPDLQRDHRHRHPCIGTGAHRRRIRPARRRLGSVRQD